jgi:hypothetical protein
MTVVATVNNQLKRHCADYQLQPLEEVESCSNILKPLP